MRNGELFRTIASLFSESRGTKPFEKYGNEVSFHDVKPAGSDNKYIRYETVKHTVKDFFFFFVQRISPETSFPHRQTKFKHQWHHLTHMQIVDGSRSWGNYSRILQPWISVTNINLFHRLLFVQIENSVET